MTPLLSTLVWCIVQVTLFAGVAGIVYLAARRLGANLAPPLLAGSLTLVLLLTILAGSPWPRWQWTASESPTEAAATDIDAPSAVDSGAPITEPSNQQPQLSPYFQAWRAFKQSIAAPQAASDADSPTGNGSAMTIVWWFALACLVASAARLAWGVWHVQGLLNGSTPIEDDHLEQMVAAFCDQLDCPVTVSLRQSTQIVTPATVGLFRQHILLPVAWLEWTNEELRAVLAHELSHVAARDYRAWLVARLAVAVHFYHPLVRWLASRLQLEQELAADATAAQLLGDRQQYLTCLASLALATPAHRLAGPARTLIPSRSLLMRRVEMLRTTAASQSPRNSSRLRLGGVGLLGLVALAIAGIRGPAVSVAEEPEGVLTEVLAAQEVERIPLSYVPTSAVFALSLRPAGLLTDQELVKELDQFEGLGVLQQAGLSVQDIAEVMIVAPGTNHARPRSIVRFKSPEACLVYVNDWMQRAGRVEVFDNAQRWRSHSEQSTRLDPSTLAFEEYATVEARGGQLPPLRTQERHPWAEEWNKQDASHLSAAVNVAATRASFQQELQEAVQRGGGFPMQTLAPLVDHVDWAVAGVDLGDKLRLRVTSQCDTEEHAQQIANIMQAMITLSGVAVEQQASVMQAELAKLPPEQADQMRPMGEKAIALAKEFVTGAKPAANGDRVELAFDSVQLDINSSATAARLLMPAVIAARHAARRAQSSNDLRQLSLAMLNYESVYGSYPPAVLYKEGSPHPYSWRVAILPFLEQQALYNLYRFDEPWDSEANKKIAETVVPVFQSSFDEPGSTNSSYFVLTGPETVFAGKEGTKLREITDGTSKTMLIVEAKRAVPWTKPEDIPYAANKPLPELGGWMPNLFLTAFCDGSVQTMTQDLDDKMLRSMITKAGKEMVQAR